MGFFYVRSHNPVGMATHFYQGGADAVGMSLFLTDIFYKSRTKKSPQERIEDSQGRVICMRFWDGPGTYPNTTLQCISTVFVGKGARNRGCLN